MKNLIIIMLLFVWSKQSAQEMPDFYEKLRDIKFESVEVFDKRLDFLESNDSIVFGIDFSHYSEVLSWENISNDSLNIQPKFIILRSTMGKDSIDDHFEENFKYAEQHGFIAGTYHYFRSHQNGKQQALHYLRYVDFKCNSFIPIIDIEYKRKSISETKLRRELLDCLELIEEYIGVKPMLYTNLNFYKKYLKNHSQFDTYPLWIAAYSDIRRNEVMDFADMYQYTDTHPINGIKYPVDANHIKKEKFLSLILR